MANKKGTPLNTAPGAQDADLLQNNIRRLGDYEHISVQTIRGSLNIFSGDHQPVARLTPLGQGQYGLSFMRHTGRWEQMPFTGDISEMADTVVSTLGPYLQRYDLTSRISGSHH